MPTCTSLTQAISLSTLRLTKSPTLLTHLSALFSPMREAELATAATPVSDTDYLQLSRLVTEAAWRVDIGQADTLHELFVDDGELIVPPTNLRGRQAIQEWGRRLADVPLHSSRLRKHAFRRRWRERRRRHDGVDRLHGRRTGSGNDPAVDRWRRPRPLRAHRGRLAVPIETVGRAIHATRTLIDTIVQ